MTIKIRLVIAAVAITCTIATFAYATPIVALLFGPILASGSTNEEIMQHVKVPLHASSRAGDRRSRLSDLWAGRCQRALPCRERPTPEEAADDLHNQ
jgi:hypothetical protein